MTQPRSPRPPGLAQALLALVLPEPYREAVLGDLAEEFDRRVREQRFARLWYWGQVLRLDVWRLRKEGLRGGDQPVGWASVTWDIVAFELRQALRVLSRSPGFVAAVVLTLATGIAGTTVIFSLVNGLLLRPIPGIDDPGGLVAIQASEGGGAFGSSSYVDILDLREGTRSLEDIAVFKPRLVDASADGATEPLRALMVTYNYFDIVDVQPQMGRFFGPEVDEGAGAHPQVVLTDGLWRRWFAAATDVVGQALVVNGQPYTIIGVAPRHFRGTQVVEVGDFFVPITMQPNLMPESGFLLDRRGWGGVQAIGRLHRNATLESADAEVGGFAERLASAYPATNVSRLYRAVGLRQAAMPGTMRSDVMRLSALLFAVVGALWLVVCLNVSNLLLARTMRRRQELAVRRALGSGRRRIVGQLLVEFMAIALTAGFVAVVLARTMASGVARLPLPISIGVDLDWVTVGFVGAMAIASGILCALPPSVLLSRRELPSVAGGSSKRTRRRWPSRVLIVSQVAVSLVLVFATGLFVRSFANLANADPGFDSAGLLTAQFRPELQGYDSQETLEFFRRLSERSAGIPGVEAVAMADALPSAGNFGQDSWFFENARDPEQGSSLYRSVVSANFFETLGIPIVQGRGFSDLDSPERPPVVIVNEAAARLVEARTGRQALGQSIGPAGPGGPFLEIVGVVGDTRTGRTSQAAPFVYGAHAQLLPLGLGGGQMVVLLKTTVAPESLAGALRSAALAVDPGVSASNVVTMDSYLADLLGTDRLTVAVLGISSLLAMALVAIGVYGLLAYVVSQRTHEFGVRLALGARARSLTGIVLREALLLAIAGLSLGAAGALAVLRFAESQLFGVTSTDPASLTIGVVTVIGVTLAAAYLPARRATRIDPLVAIQTD